MLVLIVGLLVFLGVHSTRIVAEDWRTRQLALRGEKPFKGIFSLVSLVGFILIVWGFGMARQQPVVIWQPPVWTRHLAATLTLIALVMVTAAYVPANHIKARLKDPMILGVKVWAVAHLLSNGTLAEIILFGSFLVWAVFDFRATRQRRRTAPGAPYVGTASGTVVTVVAGAVIWAAFAFFLHRWLIGVQPIP